MGRVITYSEAKERAILRVIQTSLERNGGNRTKAAKDLGLERTYLQRLLRKYALK